MSTTHEMILGGHGGQGIIMASDLMGLAATELDLHALTRMVYGAEMRGGMVECTFVISDDEITTPYVTAPGAVLAMNDDAWERHAGLVRPGGVVVVNASIVSERSLDCDDVEVVRVPCVEIADEVGSAQTATVVALGALLASTDALPLDAVEAAFVVALPARRHALIPTNVAALRAGAEYVHTRSSAPARLGPTPSDRAR